MRPPLLLATVLLIAGCTGGGATNPTDNAAEPGTTGGASMLPPIFVDEDLTDVTAHVGDTLVVTTEGVTEVTTDAPQILQVEQGGDQGTYTTNPGAEVLAAGSARLFVSGADGELFTVTVTATP